MLKYLIMDLWFQSWQKTSQNISPQGTNLWGLVQLQQLFKNNSGSSVFQGKTHRPNNYLKDFFLVWIWVIQSPSLVFAIPSFARLSAVIRSLSIQRYLQIKKKNPKLKWRSQSRVVKLCCSFWGYHKWFYMQGMVWHTSLLFITPQEHPHGLSLEKRISQT